MLFVVCMCMYYVYMCMCMLHVYIRHAILFVAINDNKGMVNIDAPGGLVVHVVATVRLKVDFNYSSRLYDRTVVTCYTLR